MSRYPFTVADELRLADAARAGDRKAMQVLVRAAMPLARRELRRLPLGGDFDDVQQELGMRIVACVYRFDGRGDFANLWRPHIRAAAQNWRRVNSPSGFKTIGKKQPTEIRLDAPALGDEDFTRLDLTPSECDTHAEVERRELADKVRKACKSRKLDRREREMLALWLAADPELGPRNVGHSDIAKDMGVSRERVRQLWNRMVPRLREVLEPLVCQ